MPTGTRAIADCVVRWAALIGSVSGMLVATACSRAQISLSDLPPTAHSPSLSVYFEASVVGVQLYTCGMTDARTWAWMVRASEATLVDGHGERIGDYAMHVTIIPPPPGLGSTWQGVIDGKVIATLGARGQGPGDTRVWDRYDVQEREGTGQFTEAKSIVRISRKGTLRPSGPCDQSHAGAEFRVSYSGTDLFLK